MLKHTHFFCVFIITSSHHHPPISPFLPDTHSTLSAPSSWGTSPAASNHAACLCPLKCFQDTRTRAWCKGSLYSHMPRPFLDFFSLIKQKMCLNSTKSAETLFYCLQQLHILHQGKKINKYEKLVLFSFAGNFVKSYCHGIYHTGQVNKSEAHPLILNTRCQILHPNFTLLCKWKMYQPEVKIQGARDFTKMYSVCTGVGKKSVK